LRERERERERVSACVRGSVCLRVARDVVLVKECSRAQNRRNEKKPAAATLGIIVGTSAVQDILSSATR
jgi:hypothetical protein